MICDGWKNVNDQTIANVLLVSADGAVFREAKEFREKLSGEVIARYLLAHIQEFGADKIVQIVTDNGSNFLRATRLIKEVHPKIYTTSRAAHCLDLFLEDSCKSQEFKTVIGIANKIVKVINNHVEVKRLFLDESQKMLIKYAVTRFYTHFLSLSRIYELREAVVETLADPLFENWVK
ncbi:hypothetical protein GEMRC1_011270 [Eukaryota sp. GEM-RC1]